MTYSKLSLNGHLYKVNTSVKWSPTVGPWLSLLSLLTDISLKIDSWCWSGPKGVCLRESCVYTSPRNPYPVERYTFLTALIVASNHSSLIKSGRQNTITGCRESDGPS